LWTSGTAEQFPDFGLCPDGFKQPIDSDSELVTGHRLLSLEGAIRVALNDAEASQLADCIIRPVGDGNIFGHFLRCSGFDTHHTKRKGSTHKEVKPHNLPHVLQPLLTLPHDAADFTFTHRHLGPTAWRCFNFSDAAEVVKQRRRFPFC
jgi:hypothetical protein